MEKDYIIRLEQPTDYKLVENVVRESFWNIYRPGCLEHYVLHCYRDNKDFVKELDFVILKGNEIIGQTMFVKAVIKTDDNKDIPIMTFGPICILPKYQKQGYGKILLDYSLEKAKQLGCGAVCMEGNIKFYGKSGFIVASKKNIHYYAEPKENEVPYFLLKELKEGFLNNISGTYKTPEGYFVDEKEAEEFDKNFKPKQKLKLPGQIF